MRECTIVAFHAHPDDETLLTGGTLARAAAEGHRVVLVTATLGEAGLAASRDALGSRRRAELLQAAAALGCARVETLGYADSGLNATPAATSRFTDMPTDAGPDATAAGTSRFADVPADSGLNATAAATSRFADVPVDEAAARLAEILREEHADVLTGYDANGGYGHPDHLQVHRVARAASALTGTALLEATVDRTALRPLLAVLRLAGRFLPSLPFGDPTRVFTARQDITHVADVRGYWRQKRAAMRAHCSQTEGGPGIRTLSLLSRLPGPLFRAVCGREWFVEQGPLPPPDLTGLRRSRPAAGRPTHTAPR